jgi:hypothetical protein
MGKPCSMHRHQRIVARLEVGQSCQVPPRVFGVSASTAVRLAAAQRQRVQGHVAPMPQGRAPSVAGKLGPHRRSCWRSSGELTGHFVA